MFYTMWYFIFGIINREITKRVTGSAIIVEVNMKDAKLVKTNISSLHSKRHLQSILLFT